MINALRPARLASVFLAFSFAVFLLSAAQAQQETKLRELQPLPLEEISIFTKVFETIKSSYVEPITDQELLNNAIRGMIAGLDPHSSFLNRDEMSNFEVETTGRYGGLGIEITKEPGGIRVVTPIDDSPASAAGIRPGDLIIRLDDAHVDRLTISDAVDLMRGEPGSDIKLTIIRQGVSGPMEFVLTRAVIRIRSARSYLLEPEFGYVRITQFQTSTPELVRSEVQKMRDNAKQISGLVLDLRNNPGGELRSAVGISDLFIENGVIVTTKDRDGVIDQEYRATPGDILNGVPVVVLVNEGSASASEVVAGALQDHRRAVIMGKTTFGKASVQTILPISQTATLKLTTHRYYTPNDRSIQAEGIVPDIVVELVELPENQAQSATTIREGDLSGAIENENSSGEGEEQSFTYEGRDYQLQQALNLLKALQIAQSADG